MKEVDIPCDPGEAIEQAVDEAYQGLLRKTVSNDVSHLNVVVNE